MPCDGQRRNCATKFASAPWRNGPHVLDPINYSKFSDLPFKEMSVIGSGSTKDVTKPSILGFVVNDSWLRPEIEWCLIHHAPQYICGRDETQKFVVFVENRKAMDLSVDHLASNFSNAGVRHRRN